MRLISFDIEDRMKTLGWYQIIGALTGFSIVVYLLINEGAITGGYLFLCMVAILLCCYSFYCGNLLRKINIKGLHLSVWNQALQVFQISFWAITFSYHSGIRLSFGFNWDKVFIPDAALSVSDFSFAFNTPASSNLSVFINVIPIIIIYWIGKIEKDIDDRKNLLELSKKTGVENVSEINVPLQK